MELITKVMNLGQSWQATYKYHINNPAQTPDAHLKRFVDLAMVGAQVFSFAQIVRHILEQAEKTYKKVDITL